MGKIYCRSGNMAGNIEEAIEAQLAEINVSGKRVLLKPNMVDPTIKKACSNPGSLQIAVNSLRNHGAAEVLIGDEPALYFFEEVVQNRVYDPNMAYANIGYNTITGATLFDLRTLPITSFQATRLDPITAKETKIQIPIRNTAGLLVVSHGFPKHHGNFNYTGVLKNLMGLVPANQRPEFFHQSFVRPRMTQAQVFDLAMNFADKTRGMETVDRAYNLWLEDEINPNAFMCHLEHIINAGALVGLREYFNKLGGFCLLDGTYLMKEHEHDGNLVKTDFAIAGKDPANVDYAALEKLGINPLDVPYLQNCRNADSYKIKGYLGKPLEPTFLLQKYGFTDSHKLGFFKCPGKRR